MKLSVKERIVGLVIAFLLASGGGQLVGAGLGMSFDIYRCGWRIQSFEYYSAAIGCLLAGGSIIAVAATLWFMCWSKKAR